MLHDFDPATETCRRCGAQSCEIVDGCPCPQGRQVCDAGIVVLFLDLSTQTGFAAGRPGSEPVYGSFVVAPPNTPCGIYLAAFEAHLMRLIGIHDPTLVCYEAPFLAGTRKDEKGRQKPTTSMETMEKLLGLSGVTQMVAYREKIECAKADNQVVAKWFVGAAQWPGVNRKEKRDLKKAMTVSACLACGFKPANDDEADAIAGWAWTCSRVAPQFRARRWDGPLLGRAS